MKPWWWLSFADPELPKGLQFLGACLVQAEDERGAITEAWLRHLNPGGEVAIVGPLAGLPPGVSDEYANILLTRVQCEEMDRVAAASKRQG